MSSIRKKKNDSDEEEEEEPKKEESEVEKFLEENVESEIERVTKKRDRFDAQVKQKLIQAKRYEGEAKENLKMEALKALKKKKFYEKRLEKLNDRKFKKDMKIMNEDIKKQKKELRQITNEFKKKIALLTSEGIVDNENEEVDEDDMKKFDIDVPEEEVNKEYNQLIMSKEVNEASKNLNIFKFIFQD